MSDDLKVIAERLRGLREVMDVSVEEAAEVCCVSVDEYKKYESGNVDIPIGILKCMAKKYNFELTALIDGDEPRMHHYFLVRKDKGLSVERRKDYKYQSLAYGFANRKADPFMISVDADENKELHFNSHPGQEFNYVIEGTLKIIIDKKEFILDPGDCIYFDSTRSHAMKAMNNRPAKFLAVIF